MKQLRRIFLKLCRLFTNSREEAELAREIAAHLALLEDDYLRHGMAPEEARQAARRAYGGVEQAKQMHRNERSYQGLAQTLQDTRHTLRQLRDSPGFTLTAILTEIAFLFAISSTLPKVPYLTFIDAFFLVSFALGLPTEPISILTFSLVHEITGLG